MANDYQKAKEKFIRELDLNPGDEHSQDWEYEAADAGSINAFLACTRVYGLSTLEKRMLSRLLLESYNDYVGQHGLDMYYSTAIKMFLREDRELFTDIIQEWSCEGAAPEDSFYITPLIREVMED